MFPIRTVLRSPQVKQVVLLGMAAFAAVLALAGLREPGRLSAEVLAGSRGGNQHRLKGTFDCAELVGLRCDKPGDDCKVCHGNYEDVGNVTTPEGRYTSGARTLVNCGVNWDGICNSSNTCIRVFDGKTAEPCGAEYEPPHPQFMPTPDDPITP